MWQVQKWDVGTSEWVDVDFADINVKKSLDELNSATVQLSQYIAPDTEMRILYDGNIVFRGIVQKVRTETGGVYNVELVEYASELKKQLVQVGGSYRIEWINKTANEVIDDILSSSGWTRVSSDTTNLGTVTVEYADRLSALSKIVKEMLGHHLWFTYNREVYFGSFRTDRTGVELDYVEKNVDEDASEVYDGVIVLGAGDGINQKSYTLGTGTRFKVFLAKGAKTDDELQRITQVLYDAATTIQKRWEITTELHTEIEEGDLITVDGEDWVVYTVEHSLSDTRLVIGSSEPTLSQILNSKLRGIEEVSYVAQGVTNVSNFGGWETAVDDEHPARYKFYLPDESVGYIRVNECFINVYGRAYRIWSKGSAAGSTGEDANYIQTLVTSGDVYLDSSSEFKTWIDLCSFTPSDFTYDLTYIFAYFAISAKSDVYDPALYTIHFRLLDDTTGDTLKQQTVEVEGTGSDSYLSYASSSVTMIWAGKRDPTHTYKIQAYVNETYYDGDRVWINGYTIAISGHDHGTHVHDPEPGIYETENYPSNVTVKLYNSTNPSGVVVADPSTHSGLSGGSEFSVTKIDITSYVAPGENTIEVISDTLGTVQVDGFYRIFIETAR